jgi:hypothetical protein
MKYYSVYIKSAYDKGAIRTYTFKDKVQASKFALGAREDSTYWGLRVTEGLPTEHERDSNFLPVVLMD